MYFVNVTCYVLLLLCFGLRFSCGYVLLCVSSFVVVYWFGSRFPPLCIFLVSLCVVLVRAVFVFVYVVCFAVAVLVFLLLLLFFDCALFGIVLWLLLHVFVVCFCCLVCFVWLIVFVVCVLVFWVVCCFGIVVCL